MVECKKTHLAVWVGSQYMATCYFPLREEATSPSLTPSTHTPHHRCSAFCLFVDLALSSNTIHAHTLWLQIHPRWYLETPNTINVHTLRLQIPYTGIPCDFKYHPRTYLETSNTIHGHTLRLQIPSTDIPWDSRTRKVPVVFPGSNNILSASLRSKSNHHLHKKKHDVER